MFSNMSKVKINYGIAIRWITMSDFKIIHLSRYILRENILNCRSKILTLIEPKLLMLREYDVSHFLRLLV